MNKKYVNYICYILLLNVVTFKSHKSLSSTIYDSWQMMKGAKDFYMINVTCESIAALEKQASDLIVFDLLFSETIKLS